MKGKVKSKRRFVGARFGCFAGVNLLRAIVVMICLTLLTVRPGQAWDAWFATSQAFEPHIGSPAFDLDSACQEWGPFSAIDLAAEQGDALYFAIDVPAGASTLSFEMYGGTGDADIYVRYGSVPTLTEYDYRPYVWGNDETVEIESPEQGQWHVMVHGYSAFDGVVLDAYSLAESFGFSAIDLTAEQGDARYFTIDIPEGASTLSFEMYGGTGDGDIYVRHGDLPTFSDWDYRPYVWGNDETVEIPDPASGTWYVMIDAYDSFYDVTLQLAAY